MDNDQRRKRKTGKVYLYLTLLMRCFGNLVLDPEGTSIDLDGSKINQFRYRFLRSDTSNSHSFIHSQIGLGDPVVVSDELGHFALANGFVTDLQPEVLY